VPAGESSRLFWFPSSTPLLLTTARFMIWTKMRKTARKFVVGFCFIVLIALPIFSQADLSSSEARSFIKAELSKKGFRDLKVIYAQSKVRPEYHNVFIEFGAKERTAQEINDIWYGAALIIAALQPVSRYIPGLEIHPVFKIIELRFMKMGKLTCWIHADDCVKAISDGVFRTRKEREAFILSRLHHER